MIKRMKKLSLYAFMFVALMSFTGCNLNGFHFDQKSNMGVKCSLAPVNVVR
jgi:hypothetical protein